MIKKLRQQIRGYVMPEYLIEILTRHYCDCFLPMTILRQNDSYQFSYDTGTGEKLNTSQMTPQEKVKLFLLLIQIGEECEDHLISGERYLIEPQLLYRQGDLLNKRTVRLLFYPDLKSQSFAGKLLRFYDAVGIGINQNAEIQERIRGALEEGDLMKTERLLEKFLQKQMESAT